MECWSDGVLGPEQPAIVPSPITPSLHHSIPSPPRCFRLQAARHSVYERAVILNLFLAMLAGLSLVLLIWQWLAARRFPLHERIANTSFEPPVTLLKSLKGCDAHTEKCLRSWFEQDYAGDIQVLFAVASGNDPVCDIVRQLAHEFSTRDVELIVCGPLAGTNSKVAKLAELEKLAKHDILVISDADVLVPRDFLANAMAPFSPTTNTAGTAALRVGLVSCFYRLANPTTLAMQWEAVAMNTDFWSQVLQSKTLKPLDFALGAVMVTQRARLSEVGGFKALADCLADDYQLGNRIARNGYRIELCPVVVECWDPPMTWRSVWKHQLRWARTIRVCQPAPYFFSILSNPTFWPLAWLMALPGTVSLAFFLTAIAVRIVATFDLKQRLTQSRVHAMFCWMAPIKDLLQVAIWLCAFAGNRIEWRGQRYRLRHDGTLVKI
jgi:ceramide glucosyltransferase